MRIILLGPPGAGKGTQSKILADKLQVAHISTGNLLRKNVAEQTELGKIAKGYMDKGALVPDELVTQMVLRSIEGPDTKKGFILDGYPRNINQAETLDEMLRHKDMEIDLAMYLDTSVPVIIQRLSGRLVCSKCGANYHRKNMPPHKDMLCDSCGSALYQRSDDREETIRTRLEVYHKESAPLVEYYEKKNKLISVKADEDAPVVLERMLELIGRYNDQHKVREGSRHA
jgi:adenylate kinase